MRTATSRCWRVTSILLLGLFCTAVIFCYKDFKFRPSVQFQVGNAIVTMAKPRLQAFRNFPRELRTKIRSVTLVEVAGTWQMDNSIQISKVLNKELLQAAMELFHKFINQTDFQCPEHIRAGGQTFGGYEVCVMPGLQLVPGSCLVYSFGINNEWSFDDDMSLKFHCEVHSFDPMFVSMKKLDYQRSERHLFHNLGIWDKEAVNDRGWKLNSLTGIISNLGHENVDAEGAEWPCLVDWLNSGILSRQVKQLAIEVHTPKFRVLGQTMTLDDHLRITWLFEELPRQGFHKYLVGSGNDCCSRFSDWALEEKFIHCCYELFYVNSKFLQ